MAVDSCARASSFLCCVCSPVDREPACLIDKSNVGRFDCVPSTCMHFPQVVRGILAVEKVGATGKAGRVLHSLACAECDVEQQEDTRKFGAGRVGGACLRGRSAQEFLDQQAALGPCVPPPAFVHSLHCIWLGSVTREVGNLLFRPAA